MNIEQRHVTTVNMQDGKPRDFVVSRDSRGCKVSCLTTNEVLNLVMSPQDFQRLCQAVVQPSPVETSKDSSLAPEAGADGSVEGGQPWTTVRIEQRQVTTVALHPSKARDFTVSKDDRGCKISSVARDEVVTLLLSTYDFHRLRQQLGRWEWRDVRREPQSNGSAVQETCEVSVPITAQVAPSYSWGGIDWLGFN